MQWVGNHINDGLRSRLTCSGVSAVREEAPNDHPDHLGSSSFITDAIGYATQHLQYLPFGETFVDQKAGSFDSRYKFSAKEKDDETGYSYFGARYYDSDLSVWLSVDPLAKEYPSLSPYMYVAGNPVKLVDPDGNRIYLRGSREQKEIYINLINQNTTNVRASVGFLGVMKVKVVDPNKANSSFDQCLLDSYNNKDHKVKMNLSTMNSAKNDHFYITYRDPRADEPSSIEASLNGLSMANDADPLLFKLMTQEAIDKAENQSSNSDMNKRSTDIFNESENKNYSSIQVNKDNSKMRDGEYKINIYDRSQFDDGRDQNDIIQSYMVTFDVYQKTVISIEQIDE